MTHRRHSLALALTAGLVLAACSGTPDVTEPEAPNTPVEPQAVDGGGSASDDPTSSATSGGATSAPGGTTGPSATGQTDGRGDPQAYNQGALAAVQRAAESAEGVAFQLDDQDDGSWRVDVAVGPNEVEVTVSADGAQVSGSRDRGPLDAEDAAGLAAATIPMRQVVETALGQHDGFLEEVELDEEGGRYVWVVHIDRPDDDVDVHVDVADGSVVRTDR